MKKTIVFIITGIMAAGILAGCGSSSPDVDGNALSISKKGEVTETLKEDFSASNYDEDELSDYIDSQIESYTSDEDHGNVKSSGFSVKDGTASLTVKYENAETFSDFSGLSLFQGNIVSAQTAGYDFSVSFVSVSEGQKKDTADAKEVISSGRYNIVIVNAPYTVTVPGDIVYVSSENTEVIGEDTVTISAPSDSEIVSDVYIVYE